MKLRRETLVAATAVVLVSAIAATHGNAGIEPPPWRPASLVSTNLFMQGGRPFVALSELAKALGGTGRWDPIQSRYEIQPGPNGVLAANPGALGALGLSPTVHGAPQVAGQTAVKLGFGGGDVMIDNSELVLLHPADPAISLNFLARLLGGQARFDPGKGFWVLPPGLDVLPPDGIVEPPALPAPPLPPSPPD